MEVILLEKVGKLGDIGDVANVKAGYDAITDTSG